MRNPSFSTSRTLLLGTALLAASVASAQYRISRTPREVKVYVGNSRVRFDRVQPVLSGRRLLIPLRGVFEKMGATVTYDKRRHRVLASRGKTRLVMTLNGPNRRAYVNGQPKRMDAFPTISRGHVLVPLRFVAQTLNASVIYSAPDSRVRIIPR